MNKFKSVLAFSAATLLLAGTAHAGSILQTLGGDVTQTTSGGFQVIEASTDSGDALVDLMITQSNTAQGVGSGAGIVMFSEATDITQDTLGNSGGQGGGFNPIALFANSKVEGDATVSGGMINDNKLNTAFVGTTAGQDVEVYQSADTTIGIGTFPLSQGGISMAGAYATEGTATATDIDQEFYNSLNVAVGATADTGMDVYQGANYIFQGGNNDAGAYAMMGESFVDGTQAVENVINLAASNSAMILQQGVGPELEQDAINLGGAGIGDMAAPTLDGAGIDPSITMDQSASNTVNKAVMTKTTGQAYLTGIQWYEDGPGMISGTQDNQIAGNLMIADATWLGAGYGDVSVSGTQTAQAENNTVEAWGGLDTGSGLNEGLEQTAATDVWMGDLNIGPTNNAWAQTEYGNASVDVAQNVVGSLNVVSANGPISGNYTQDTNAVNMSFSNTANATTMEGNADISGSQSVVNSLNVIR